MILAVVLVKESVPEMLSLWIFRPEVGRGRCWFLAYQGRYYRPEWQVAAPMQNRPADPAGRLESLGTSGHGAGTEVLPAILLVEKWHLPMVLCLSARRVFTRFFPG